MQDTQITSWLLYWDAKQVSGLIIPLILFTPFHSVLCVNVPVLRCRFVIHDITTQTIDPFADNDYNI